MAFLPWNDSFSVGVKTIDEQHSGLFRIVDELHAAMMKGQAQRATGELLKKLVKYTQAHFAFEEKAMAATNYPAFTLHRMHHQDLTRQVETFMARYERGDGTINIELLRFLREWLTKHIQHEDKQYGPWMKEHGVH